MKKKSIYAGLAQENGFFPEGFLSLLKLVKSTGKESCAPVREECNKYDLPAAPWFWLANHNDWSKWFATSSSHLFAVVALSVLWVGGAKK